MKNAPHRAVSTTDFPVWVACTACRTRRSTSTDHARRPCTRVSSDVHAAMSRLVVASYEHEDGKRGTSRRFQVSIDGGRPRRWVHSAGLTYPGAGAKQAAGLLEPSRPSLMRWCFNERPIRAWDSSTHRQPVRGRDRASLRSPIVTTTHSRPLFLQCGLFRAATMALCRGAGGYPHPDGHAPALEVKRTTSPCLSPYQSA